MISSGYRTVAQKGCECWLDQTQRDWICSFYAECKYYKRKLIYDVDKYGLGIAMDLSCMSFPHGQSLIVYYLTPYYGGLVCVSLYRHVMLCFCFVSYSMCSNHCGDLEVAHLSFVMSV